jgi:hypothetical protein
MEHMRRLLRRPVTWIVLAVGLVGLIVGLSLFEPWRAFTHSRVDEALPVAATATGEASSTVTTVPAPVPAPSLAPVPAPQQATQPPAKPVEVKVLAEGRFVNGEHSTSGTARVLGFQDGSRVLRLENFATSDGPDVHVWLTDRRAGGPDGSFDDGRYVKLGEMKATEGNQNYPIPASADLTGLHSAVIWCDRFNVAFGSASLDP